MSTRVNQALVDRLAERLQLSKSQVYRLIEKSVRSTKLPRRLAAIALAAERDINISQYASDDELAVVRQATTISTPVTPVSLPARSSSPIRAKAPKSPEKRRGTSVFVVHGRNEKLRKAMFAFLRSVGLNPIEWNKAIALSKKGSPYVGDILETVFHEAVAVVVLLTPDDEVRLNAKYRRKEDRGDEGRLIGQARPNVLFEAGMAFGKNAGSTILVQIGDVKTFSDVSGRHLVKLTNDPTKRRELITKLANAGCNVDASGTDWLTEGDFRVD